MYSVVCGADQVRILDEDVHSHEGTDTAKERTEDIPHEDGASVLLEVHSVAERVGGKSVTKLVLPDD